MTVVLYEKKSDSGIIAEVEQNKFEKCFCLFITDKYGRTLKKGYYHSIDNAKQAGNRFFKKYVYSKCSQWEKVYCELLSVYGKKVNEYV